MPVHSDGLFFCDIFCDIIYNWKLLIYMKENFHDELSDRAGSGLYDPAFIELDHSDVFRYRICVRYFYEKAKKHDPALDRYFCGVFGNGIPADEGNHHF